MTPALTPEELRRLLAQRPELRPKLGGSLEGPATDARPDVAPWDFPQFAEEHPEVTMDDLLATRFPIITEGQMVTITSIQSELRPLWDDQDGPRLTAENVIRKYEILADAGAARWDSDTRALVIMVPFTALGPLYQDWMAEVREKSSDR